MNPEAITEVLRIGWCDALGVLEVADDDDFFALGGNSVLAVSLVEHVERHAGIGFPLEVLFLDGRFGALAQACRDCAQGELAP